jgi:hypothetical protein
VTARSQDRHSDSHLSDLEQRRQDAAVGRALRETEAILPDAPRLHVSWSTDRGGTSGRMLVDHPLYSERVAFAEAARDLYEAAAEYAEETR